MVSIIQRLGEPSSYAGIAGLLYGIGEVFKVKELAPLAETTAQAGQAVAQGAGFEIGIATILAGILAIFLPEAKNK